MSVTTQYPQHASRLESLRNGETLANFKNTFFEISSVESNRCGSNPFAQYPDGEGKKTSADSHRDNSPLPVATPLSEAARRTRRQALPDRGARMIDAFRAASVDAWRANGRLEDDDALMARLARASGLYAGTPSAAGLTTGQRQKLVRDLLQAFAKDIDWATVLGPDATNPRAVYYDGLTLRNAAGQPLAKVAEAVEARIDAALREHRIDAGFAGLARQLRRTVTDDPTLSLQPPADIAYGSPQWASLWTGMRTLSNLGLDPGKRQADDLIAVGRAAIDQHAGTAKPDAAGIGRPGADIGGLLLMAHAAGRLDLHAVAQGKATITAEQLTAYYKEAFADELRMLDALAALKRAKPWTRKQLAYHNLRAAGVDPNHRVDVRSLFVPAAYGPVKITVPLPFTPYSSPLWEFYMERDKVPLDALPLPRQQSQAAGAEVPAHVATALAKLSDSLKDQFDSEFEKHKEAVGDHVAQIVDASISLYGTRHGIDMADASIIVSRTQRRITSIEYPKSENADDPLPPYPFQTLDDKESDGYFISIDTPTGKHGYFLSLADATEVPLPPDAAVDAWSRENAKRVFGAEPTLVDPLYAGALARAYSSTQLASGKRTEIAEQLKSVVPATREWQRVGAYGQTLADQLQELERGLTPFRSTVQAIRSGSTSGAVGAAVLDALMFVPAIGEGLSLGLRTGEALAMGVKLALDSAAEEGVLQAVKLGAAETASFAPALGQQAGEVLQTVAHSVIVNPADLLALLRGGGQLTVDGARAVARRLRTAIPDLASALSEAASRTKPITDGRWTLQAIADAAPQALSGGIDRLSATGGIRPEPLYRAAIAEDGSRLALQRHGERGYTAYNPQTLAAEGDLLVPDAQGKLYRSLPVGVLERCRVADPSARAALAKAAASPDGTLMLGSKRYAAVNGDYLEIVADHATTTPERPVWRIRGAALPGTKDGAPLLAWDKDLHMWREAQTPRVEGGGRFLLWNRKGAQEAGTGAIETGHGAVRISPGLEQQRAFHDAMVQGVRGGATAQQVGEVRALLARMQADPRGSRILKAMAAYHELMGETPEIVLLRDGDTALPRPSLDRPVRGKAWHMDLAALGSQPSDAVATELGAVYNNMTGILEDVNPFAALRAKGESIVPAKLEQAWKTWQESEKESFLRDWVDQIGTRLKRARGYFLRPDTRQDLAGAIIGDLRDNVTEMRCYGGTNRQHLEAVLTNRVNEYTQTSGFDICLSAASWKRLPPLPEDVENLNIFGGSIKEFSDLPEGLKTLRVESVNLSASATRFPAGLTGLALNSNGLRRLPRLPAGLQTLRVSHNDLAALAEGLPLDLRELHLDANKLEALPANLPRTLRIISAKDNRLLGLPADLPVDLQRLDLDGNPLRQLPANITSLTACEISIQRTGFPIRSIPIIDAAQPGPRIHFSLPPVLTGDVEFTFAQARRALPTPVGESSTVAAAVKPWLADESALRKLRWDGISIALKQDKSPQGVQFCRFLDRLRDTVMYRDETLRSQVTEWLVELSRPERAALREDALAICAGSTETCDDRVVSTWNQLKRLQVNDDIRIGRYDERPADVVGMAREMYRLQVLEEVAARKVASLRVVDEVEVYLAYSVQLREKLKLTTAVPEMRFFHYSGVQQGDLDAALKIVKQRERAGFDEFFVTQYEPWQTLLKRKLGSRYDDAKAKLAQDLIGDDFKRRVEAKLVEEGLDADEPDIRRGMEHLLAAEAQYRALSALTREYLESVAVPYRPAV